MMITEELNRILMHPITLYLTTYMDIRILGGSVKDKGNILSKIDFTCKIIVLCSCTVRLYADSLLITKTQKTLLL